MHPKLSGSHDSVHIFSSNLINPALSASLASVELRIRFKLTLTTLTSECLLPSATSLSLHSTTHRRMPPTFSHFSLLAFHHPQVNASYFQPLLSPCIPPPTSECLLLSATSLSLHSNTTPSATFGAWVNRFSHTQCSALASSCALHSAGPEEWN